MKLGPIALAGALLLGFVGCKKPPPCHGDLTIAERAELQKRATAGDKICPELDRPKVSIDGDGLSLNGVKIMASDAIPSKKMARVEPLYTALRADRENWKSIHSNDRFPGTIDWEIAPDAGFIAASNAITTAAFGGYPNIHLHCGDVTIDFAYAVPLPPSPDKTPAEPSIMVRATEGTFHDAASRAAAELAAAPNKKIAFKPGAE